MKKIVILLIIISGLFGQFKWKTDPTTIRQLYVLNENYMKHYSGQYCFENEHQVVLVHNMQIAMSRIKRGNYNQNRSQEITDVIQEYVELEKQHREKLRLLKKELKELTR